MRILLLAPHPFYQERGTPIAVDLLLRALSEREETVHVLTYPEGTDVDYGDSVVIHRSRRPPLVSGVRPGLSLKKLACDAFMWPQAVQIAGRLQPDIVHAVEESVFMASHIRKRLGIPYLYDMDSLMSLQVIDKCGALRLLAPAMRWMERSAIASAEIVVPMCDSLADHAQEAGARRVHVLRDVSLLPTAPDPTRSAGLRDSLDISGKCILYVGNLEPYQGVDLLSRAFAIVARRDARPSLVIVGGRPEDMASARALAEQLGIGARTHLLGPQPLKRMASLFCDADILVSPRTRGSNTPMKVYSYLASGRPILATRLPTHTQVLDDDTAMLAEPDPGAFAQAMGELLGNDQLQERLARNAAAVARAKYSPEVYRQAVNEIYDGIRERLATRRADPGIPH